jgi:ribosomal-protein-alanine N-acetyltransferase
MLEPDFSQFPEITTARLLLRRITNEDAGEIFSMRSNEDVMKYLDRPRAQCMRDAEAYIEIVNKSLDLNDGILWGIALKEDRGRLIGYIGYWRMKKEHYRAEIGYMLDPAFWRKGIMREAMLAVLDYGFDVIHLHSIEANINPGNSASAGILEATGFVKEAHFKEDFFFDGTFRDTVIYSRLK